MLHWKILPFCIFKQTNQKKNKTKKNHCIPGYSKAYNLLNSGRGVIPDMLHAEMCFFLFSPKGDPLLLPFSKKSKSCCSQECRDLFSFCQFLQLVFLSRSPRRKSSSLPVCCREGALLSAWKQCALCKPMELKSVVRISFTDCRVIGLTKQGVYQTSAERTLGLIY